MSPLWAEQPPLPHSADSTPAAFMTSGVVPAPPLLRGGAAGAAGGIPLRPRGAQVSDSDAANVSQPLLPPPPGIGTMLGRHPLGDVYMYRRT